MDVQNKREKKGFISYQSEIGTSLWRRYVLGHHTAEHSVLEKVYCNFRKEEHVARKERQKKTEASLKRTSNMAKNLKIKSVMIENSYC